MLMRLPLLLLIVWMHINVRQQTRSMGKRGDEREQQEVDEGGLRLQHLKQHYHEQMQEQKQNQNQNWKQEQEQER